MKGRERDMALKGRAAGFTLIELLIAMVMTLIIGGAIVSMLIGGETMFKVQPEVSDMQQNGRAALDMIMRDVASAGSGVPPTMQVFTRADTDGTLLDGMGPMAPSGQNTDELEILYDDSGLGALTICGIPGVSSTNIRLASASTPIVENQLVTIIMADGSWTVRQVTNKGVMSSDDCGNGSETTQSCTTQCQGHEGRDHEQLTFNSGGPAGDYNPTGNSRICQPSPSGLGTDPGAGCSPEYLVMNDIIRYRIQLIDGVPYLQRRSLMEGNEWRSVARGIEDLQVEYRASAAGSSLLDSPVLVARNADNTLNWGTLTTEVQVSLSARSEMPNVKGAVHPVDVNGDPVTNAPARLRATFVSHAAPRATLYAATQAPASATVWE